MRSKFALNPKVKGFVEWQLEHYHEDKKQLEQYKEDLISSAVQGYSMTAGIQSGSVSKPTEQTAIKLATSTYILSTERSVRAIDAALNRCDEVDKQLISLVYWRGTHTVAGAGMRAGISRSAAYYRINNILVLIATQMGLIKN